MNRPVDDLAWRNPDLLGRCLHVPAMLSNDERTIIAYAAQRLRRRHPVIVELGCYIGASTMALVDGLLARPKTKPPRRAVIHSYDRFIADQFMVDHSLKEHGVEAGGNFEHVLATMLGDAQGLVEVHAGDIRTERWTGKPIDLLFVDILWGWDINQHVIDQFYAHLRPGSVLLHQDFIYSFYPWLTCSMEWLVQRGVFAYEHYAPPSTVSFRSLRRLTEPERTFPFGADLSVDEQVSLIATAADRFEGYPRALIRLSLTRLYTDAGRHDEARAAYERVAQESGDPIIDHHLSMMRDWLQTEGHPIIEG